MNCTSNGCSKSFVHLKTLVACWGYHLRGCIITPAGDVTTTLWRNLGTPGRIGFTQLSLLVLVWGMSPISRDATFLVTSSNSRITVNATFLLISSNSRITVGNMKECASFLCHSNAGCPAKVRSVVMNPLQRSIPSKVLNFNYFVVLR